MRDPKATVPAADSARNSEFRDVIGSKADTHDGDSIFSHAHIVEEHIHKSCLTYPTLANGELVESDGAGWTLSAAFKEIVPNAAIGDPFDIHWISIEVLTANDVYELWLYGVEVFIGRVRFTKNAQMDGTLNVPFQCPILAAGTQIQAKLASGAGGSDARISIYYHTY